MLTLRLFTLVLGGLLLAPTAHAQQARIVSTCSAQANRAGDSGILTTLTNGDLCVSNAAGSATVGSQEQDVRATGTLNAATANAALTYALNGQSTLGLTFTGLAASGAIVTFEQSNDGGTTWTGVNEVNAGTGVPSATRNTDGQTRVAGQGRTNLRIRVSTTGTGSITVASNISVREGLVTLASPLPPGTNSLGSVSADLRIAGTGVAASNPVPVSTIRATTFSEATSTSVGANANLIGATRAVGSPANYSRFNAAVTSSQAGTLFIQGANDAGFTTPVNMASVAVSAGQFANASVPVIFPFNRAYLFNGTTAGTATLNTSYTAN